MFVIACVKVDHASSPLFWLYLGLAFWAAHFALETYLAPHYPWRRRPPA
jgi:hypothetical protein